MVKIPHQIEPDHSELPSTIRAPVLAGGPAPRGSFFGTTKMYEADVSGEGVALALMAERTRGPVASRVHARLPRSLGRRRRPGCASSTRGR